MKSGAAAVIIKDKKIFLIKRSENEGVFPGFWAGPGGRSEEGETPEETVIRETKEEIGLDFEPIELIKKGPFMVKDHEMMLYRFYGNFSGEVSLDTNEASEWKWLSYDDAIKLDLAFDWREVIEILHDKSLI